MREKKILEMDKRVLLYIVLIFVGNIIFWTMAALTDWKSTQTVFFRWDHWTYMDWFSEFMRFNDETVYAGEKPANYPALCFVIYRIFYSFVPMGDKRLTNIYEIKNMQQTIIPMAFLEITLLFFLYHILKACMKNMCDIYKEIFVVAIFMSAPYMFLYERANLMYFSIIGTFIYILKYDSEKKSERILAYLALAIAAAIKVYPAIFGILTLQKKRYGETVLLGGIGAVSFFLPFAKFGGISGVKVYFDTVLRSFDDFSELGFGYDFSIYNLERAVLSMINGYQEQATNVSRIFTLILLVIALLTSRKLWKEIVVLTLFFIFIPSFSYEYTLCFLTLPFIYMINEKCKKIHYLYTIEFVLIGFPWVHIPIEKVNYLNGEQLSHPFSLGHIIMYIGLICMLITIVIDNVWSILREVSNRQEDMACVEDYKKENVEIIEL